MAAVTGEGVRGAHHQLAARLRAAVLGPRGGGTTRRRASDAFRLGLAVIVVAVSIPVMKANSAAELSIVRAVHPPPAAISWLVTTIFWLGSAGVSVLLALVALLVPRLTAVRWIAVAAALTWGLCILLGVVLGPTAGRPPVSELAGLNAGYPVTQLAVAITVAATVLPYLSRPVHRLVWFLIAVAVVAAVCGGEALPVNAVSSIALGWGVAAGLHLAVGSPLGAAAPRAMASPTGGLAATPSSCPIRASASAPSAARPLRLRPAAWVALAFVFSQLPVVAEGWALLGAAVGQLPFGRCVALETSNTFTALVGGNVAVFAVRVRFFQRQGYDAAAAVSSGAIAATASWTIKALLFIIAIPFAAGTFHAPSSSGGHQNAVWIILAVILAAGIAAGLIVLVPRLRRLASRRIRPHLLNIWANVKTTAAEPRKLVYILVGSTLAQLLLILALGASLHAVGQRASIATLITVNTLAAIIGGAVPVPGGLGVVEAGLIAGLTSAGVPQDQAAAAVLIQRFFAAYLPPVWGWVTLAWMRRREYV